MSVRVVLIENRPLMRRTLLDMLEGHSEIEIVAATAGAQEPAPLLRAAQPAVVVFNIPAGLSDPVRRLSAFQSACPRAALVALIDGTRGALARIFIDAGVQGCFFDTDDELLALDVAVCRVARGERVYSYAALRRYVEFPELDLSPQVLRILALAAQGYRSAAIAERCALSSTTVRNSLSDAYRQLGLASDRRKNPRVLAAVRCWAWGLVPRVDPVRAPATRVGRGEG